MSYRTKKPPIKKISAALSTPTAASKNADESKESPMPSPIRCYKCRKVCLDPSSFKDQDDNSVQCDYCGKWFHKPCTNLSPSEWDIIIGKNESITYCCEGCIGQKGQSTSMINELKTDLHKMIASSTEQQHQMIQANNAFLIKSLQDMKESLFQKIDEKIDVKMKEFAISNEKLIDEKIKACLPAENMNTNEKMIEDKVKVQIEQSFDELKDREDRKNNLIVFNLKESIKQDIDEAATEDLQQLKEILKLTNPEMTENIIKDMTTEKITRLGRKTTSKDSKPRPLKINLPNEATKYKIIRKTYRLKSCSDHPKIGFKFDLTRQQQSEERELRKELEQRKAANEDVMIYRGRIIKRNEHEKLRNEHLSKQDDNKTPSQSQ